MLVIDSLMISVGSGFFEISRTFGDFDFDATKIKSMPKNLEIIKGVLTGILFFIDSLEITCGETVLNS